MKVMDGSVGKDDCAMITPPKTKKMIQARLPFQLLGTSATPKALSSMKRKHASPSPTECRSSKIVKITSRENSNDKKISETSIDEKKLTKDVLPVARENPSTDATNVSIVSDATATTDEKIDAKCRAKCRDVAQFLEKSNEPSKCQPVVLLTRCDGGGGGGAENENYSEFKSAITGSDDVSGISDESSNEELAKELDDSDDDDPEKARSSEASSDSAAANSDSDSLIGISSSDDETDEARRGSANERKEDDMGIVNGADNDKTPTSGVKTDVTSAARRRLTPKQLEKKIESTKRREERRMERIEKEKKREEERLTRQREKEMRRREKKEKEEAEKEQKRKEKEQKDLKKQMEIEQRQREKERKDRAREEDRKKREEAKEEEKRRKEEERLEAERKKQKAASTFVSFFVPKKPESRAMEEKKFVKTSNFMPFQVKADMRVAPVCRRSLSDDEKAKFDAICIDKTRDTENLYVAEMKNREKRKSGKTWPPQFKDDDVVIVEDDEVGSCSMIDQTNSTIEKRRAKLLAFAENRRPPYWGTWRKRSSAVTSRRPFSKDTKWFDYDVDSDDEWEEEEPGESLRGSDDEKDEENPDDNEYDVDNEFMVPHGYLSDEEAQADEDEEDMSPETQKFKLKILGEEFEAERKTQTSKIKPKVIGCIWQGPVNSYPENIPQKLVDFLMARQSWVRETPIALGSSVGAGESAGSTTDNTGTAPTTSDERRGARKTRVPDEALPELIRLIHGNTHGRAFLIKEFITFWNRKKRNVKADALSKSSVGEKIRELARRIACPDEGPMHLKACWYVSEEIRKIHLADEIFQLPNSWNYALTPNRRGTGVETTKISSEKMEKDDSRERDKKFAPLITQYTKKISPEEMKKQLAPKSSQISSPKARSGSCEKVAKRAQLFSVGRNEEFPKSSMSRCHESSEREKTCLAYAAEKISDISGSVSGARDETKNYEKNEPFVVDLDN